MAEAGSFAEKVKQQADIVRVIGEYVRLKKTGQNFTGLCPFHQEKTPSFAVHPVRQIYHCFGCGAGGDVFKFVMELDKCAFPEAIRTVAEKCGIAIPKPRERSPEERAENQQRGALVEMHREAAAFFARQLHETAEGKVAAAYLEDRAIDRAAITRFGLGFSPSSGDALLRHVKSKYSEELMEASGLFSREETGRLYDRFRRRIMFPIANDAGKIIAFGGRAMGDYKPKYLNSPETSIYSKSHVLYNFHRAKEWLREVRNADARYIVLVEGYVDCIRVDAAKIRSVGVVASCGTSLTEAHAQLLRRIAPRIIVWYDKDSAGQAATDRSLELLLAQQIEVEVYQYAPGGPSDPDSHMRAAGDSASEPIRAAIECLAWELEKKEEDSALDQELKKIELETPNFGERLKRQSEERAKAADRRSRKPKPRHPGAFDLFSYHEFLMRRARELFDVSLSEGKLRALNFLMPYLQRVPDRFWRSEWATRIASELRVDEPVLREALRRAAVERRAEVQPKVELLAPAVKPAERQLIHMLMEGQGFRERLAREIISGALHRGLATEKLLELLISKVGEQPDPAALAGALEERDGKLLFEVLFEAPDEATWETAENCLNVLRGRRDEQELAELQKKIEAKAPPEELNRLLTRRLDLQRKLARR